MTPATALSCWPRRRRSGGAGECCGFDEDALAHLTCEGEGVGDGVCDEKNNIELKCWDGGDCCAESCVMKNPSGPKHGGSSS
eukprot:gene24734-biopygen10461